MVEELICTLVQCSLVRYMYQKQSSRDQRGKIGAVSCNPRSSGYQN